MTRKCGVALVCLIGALELSMSPAAAQLNIIPQERIQEAANPTLAKGVAMQFDNDGILSFGTIGESEECWRGEIAWREANGTKLSITRITTSCNCVVAEWDKRANSNTSSGTIGVKFLPKGHIGGVDQKLFIYTTLSESEPSAVVRVRGKVTHSVGTRSEYPHSMGALRLRQKRALFTAEGGVYRIAIMNDGQKPLTITHDEKLTVGGAKAYTSPLRLESGEEGELIIEYSPTEGPAMLYLNGLNTPPRGRKIEIAIEEKQEK